MAALLNNYISRLKNYFKMQTMAELQSKQLHSGRLIVETDLSSKAW